MVNTATVRCALPIDPHDQRPRLIGGFGGLPFTKEKEKHFQIGGKAGIFNIKVVYFIAFLENRSRFVPKKQK